MHPKADLWFDDLSQDILPVAEALRGVILQVAPGITEEYKYRIPFYYYSGKPVCYLNHYRKGVDLGFWDGHRMHDDYGVFEDRGKKMVRHLHFTRREEAFGDHVIPLLLQGVDLARERSKR